MLPTSLLEYDLPPDRIAVHPARPRDSARLMVVSRASGRAAAHDHVRDLPRHLLPGDLLVINTTRVLPARFRGVRVDSGGRVDGLYLGPASASGAGNGRRWLVMLKCRRTKPGVVVRLHDRAGRSTGLSLRLVERAPAEPGEAPGVWVVEPIGSDEAAPAVLERIGLTPLPPYIRQARRARGEPGDDAEDRRDYQTVFAHDDGALGGGAQAAGAGSAEGSVAAPTAGLHFTPELLGAVRDRGVRVAEVTLHVGLGTFKPVETEHVEQHPMHAEWCTIPSATAALIRETRARAGRVVAVGTTAARTLESFPEATGEASGWTRLLIVPGHQWRVVDGLLTNFHLPRSTLMALVAAMLGDGPPAVERLKALYAEAVARGYRFYSFGDAMLVI